MNFLTYTGGPSLPLLGSFNQAGAVQLRKRFDGLILTTARYAHNIFPCEAEISLRFSMSIRFFDR